jgi:hypothetical protein
MFTEGNGTYRLSYDVELSGITDATNDYGQILVYSGTGYNDTDSYYTMDVTRLSPQVISFDGTGSATTAPLADSGPIVTTTNGAGLVFEYAGGDVALTFASSGLALAQWDNLSVVLPGTGALQLAGWVAQFPTLGSFTNATDNPDGDALNNLYEFALGGVPTNGALVGYLPVFQRLEEGGTNWFEYVHVQRKNPAAHGLSYSVEKNTNLVSGAWVAASNSITGIGSVDEDFEKVTNRFGMTESNEQFYKLNIKEL